MERTGADVETRLSVAGLSARVKGRGKLAAVTVLVTGIVALTWLHLQHGAADRGSVTSYAVGWLLGVLSILIGSLTRESGR